MECGVWVTVENGRAVKIEGDESAFQSRGNCCTKSQASLEAAYHPDRLRYPMKRTNPKTDDDPGWMRITWDEAFKTTVAKAQEVQERYGGCSIAGITGTSRVWPMAGTAGWIRMWGSPNGVQAWQICKGPRHFTGNLVSQFAHSWVATVDRPRVYTAWGGSTEISNYDDSCRTSVEASNQADVRIIVDPRVVTDLGKESDYHLALRPGTDAAMAMGWACIVVDHQLYDDLYVKKWARTRRFWSSRTWSRPATTRFRPTATPSRRRRACSKRAIWTRTAIPTITWYGTPSRIDSPISIAKQANGKAKSGRSRRKGSRPIRK